MKKNTWSFCCCHFTSCSWLLTMSRGNQVWWIVAIGLPKVPNTSMCGQLRHCPAAAPTWILDFRLNKAREQGRHIQERKEHSHWSAWGTEFRLLLFPKTFAFSVLIIEEACDAIWILHLFRQGGMNTQTYPSIAGIDQLESESFTFGCAPLDTGAQGSSWSPWFLTKVTRAVSLPITQKNASWLKAMKGQPWNVLRHEDIRSKNIWWEFPHYRKHS